MARPTPGAGSERKGGPYAVGDVGSGSGAPGDRLVVALAGAPVSDLLKRASLTGTAEFAERRARGLARLVKPWLDRVVRSELRLAKADHQEELRRLLLRFGVTVIDESGQRVGGSELQRGRLYQDLIRGREITISWLDEWAQSVENSAAETLADVRSELQRITREALLEAEMRSESKLTAVETARVIRQAAGKHGSFSFERALRIARTETSIAANTGQVIAYDELGITQIEWLAFKSPIWPRRHDRMAGKKVDLGELFTLPSGAQCRHPGDPSLPVGELVNCRCSTAPVRRKRPKR